MYAALSAVWPVDSVLVTESTSQWPNSRSGPADDSVGFLLRDRQRRHWLGVPAAVGVALGDRARGECTVVATIGDGSFQYSVQAIWTAVQHDLPIVFVVMRNEEYSILKSFALLEKCPGVPGMDLPGLDIVSIATGLDAEQCMQTPPNSSPSSSPQR